MFDRGHKFPFVIYHTGKMNNGFTFLYNCLAPSNHYTHISGELATVISGTSHKLFLLLEQQHYFYTPGDVSWDNGNSSKLL